MTWRDQRRTASFRGVPFIVESDDLTTGRFAVQHDHPDSADPTVEDLGGQGRAFSVQALVIGDDYLDRLGRLLDALNAPGPGALVLPFWAPCQAQVAKDGAQVRTSSKDGGMATLTLRFIRVAEAEAVRPVVAEDTVAAVEVAATEAAVAEDANLAAALTDVQGGPGWATEDVGAALDAALTDVNTAFDAVDAKINQALAPVETALATAEKGRALALAPLRRITGTMASTRGRVLGMIGRGSSLLGTPATALGLVRSLLRGGFGGWFGRGPDIVPTTVAGGGVTVDLRSILAKETVDTGLSSWSRPEGAGPVDISDLTGTTPARRTAETGKAAVDQAVRRAALVEAARAAPHVDWPSADAARADRARLAEALDAAALDAPDRLYGPLVKLRAAVIRAIDTKAAALPALATWTPAETEPALVTAARLHGDRPLDVLAAAEDLATRNGIRHPLFVPGGSPLEVLR